MASLPLESILTPVPVAAFSAVTDVLACVVFHLAAPILQQVLKTDYNVDLRLKEVENVLWKVGKYLPCLATSRATVGHCPFRLKKFQELCPEVAIVSVPCRKTPCPCGKAVEPKAGLSSAKLPNNLRGQRQEMDNPFLFFSQAAGVQRAEFTEAYCSACKLYFLGGWQYQKKPGAYHHVENLKFIGYEVDAEIFVSCLYYISLL